MLIITIIIVCIALATYFVSSDILEQLVFDRYMQELDLIAERLDTLFNKIEGESLMFIVSDSFQVDASKYQSHAEYNSFLYTSSINASLLQFLIVQPNIESITFIDTDDMWFYRDSAGRSAPQVSSWLAAQLSDFESSNIQLRWVMAPLQDAGAPQMMLFRKAYSFAGKPKGVLVIKLSEEAVNGIIPNAMEGENDFLIFDQWSQLCLLRSNTRTAQDVAGYDWPDAHNTMTRVEPGLFFPQVAFTRASLTLGILIPASAVYQNTHMLVITTVLVGLIGLLISLVLVSSTVRRQLRPLDDIVADIQLMTQGEYDARLSISTGDELQYLAERINEMADNTQRLMHDIQESSEQKKQYELDYLQLQMQPHFLYNVLETLNGMIELGDKKNAMEMTAQVANFYRQVLAHNRGDVITTIEQELDIARSYLRIMQMRYPDKFQFSCDVQQDILSCRIPKLLLQPLLENAIMHGFNGMEEGTGAIHIGGYSSRNGEVCLLVEDNGRGMPPEKARTLLHTPQNGGRTPFGVKSIEERLKVYFGKAAGISFDSRPGNGTRVTIVLPRNA